MEERDINVTTALAESEHRKKIAHQNLRDLQRQVIEINLSLEKERLLEKSEPPPSQYTRKKFERIAPEIQALVTKKIFYEGSMSWDEAIKTYDISRASISEVPLKKKGRKTPLTLDILTDCLWWLEENSTLTLLKLVDKIQEKYNILTSTSALDRGHVSCLEY